MSGERLRIWGMPVLLAVVTLAGLVGALLVEGRVGECAGVVGLGVPVLSVAWALWRARAPT